jgi:hypothetical protein
METWVSMYGRGKKTKHISWEQFHERDNIWEPLL